MWKLLPLLFLSVLAQAQSRRTFSGYVRDAASGESLPGVAVVHPVSSQRLRPLRCLGRYEVSDCTVARNTVSATSAAKSLAQMLAWAAFRGRLNHSQTCSKRTAKSTALTVADC